MAGDVGEKVDTTNDTLVDEDDDQTSWWSAF